MSAAAPDMECRADEQAEPTPFKAERRAQLVSDNSPAASRSPFGATAKDMSVSGPQRRDVAALGRDITRPCPSIRYRIP